MSTNCEMMTFNDINSINDIENVVIGIYYVYGDKISIYQNTINFKLSIFINGKEIYYYKDMFELWNGPFRTIHIKTLENGKYGISEIIEPAAIDPLTGQAYVYQPAAVDHSTKQDYVYDHSDNNDDQTTINSNQDVQMNSIISSANKSMNTEITKIDSIDSSSNNTQVLSYSKALKNNSNIKNNNNKLTTKKIVTTENNLKSDLKNKDTPQKLEKFLEKHIKEEDSFFKGMIDECKDEIESIQNGSITSIYINSKPILSHKLSNQQWIFLKFPHIIDKWNKVFSEKTNGEVKMTIKKGLKYDEIYLHHSKIIIK
jgi:hypothetical protein